MKEQNCLLLLLIRILVILRVTNVGTFSLNKRCLQLKKIGVLKKLLESNSNSFSDRELKGREAEGKFDELVNSSP